MPGFANFKKNVLDTRSEKWLLLGILIKLLFLSYFLYIGRINYPGEYRTGVLYAHSTDTPSFLEPIENLLAHGDYIRTPSDQWTRVTRMPGYGLIYLGFRLLFNVEVSKTLLVLSQVLISGMSIYFLSLIALYILQKKQVFYITFGLYSLSSFCSYYDHLLLSESFATSFLILLVYALFRYKESSQLRYIYASAILFAFSVLLKPVSAGLAGVFIFYIYYRKGIRLFHSGIQFNKQFLPFLIFIGPLLLFECCWVTRNYHLFKKLIPLQYNAWLMETNEPVRDGMFHAYRWVAAVGGDMIYYRPNTLGAWLHNNKFADAQWMPPASIYTSKYNYDSLLSTRKKFISYLNDTVSILNSDQASVKTITGATNLNQKFDEYYTSYLEEKPFNYYVINRLILLKSFLYHSGSPQLPFKKFEELKKDHFAFLLKISWSALYWVVIVFGGIGLRFLVKICSAESMLMLFTIVYLLLVFPFIIRVIEIRYLTLVYPFLTVSAALTFQSLFNRFSIKKI
jgi:hypothetical protein